MESTFPYLEEVMRLTRAGYAVLEVAAPSDDGCACRLGADCPSPGKHPVGRFWQKRATTKPKHVTMLTRLVPLRSYGLFPMPGSGVAVLDVDQPDDELMALIPETYEVRRASAPEGRGHYYLTLPDGYPEDAVTRAFRGGECRVGGSGYVVGPGCLHASGDEYVSNHADYLAVAPEALLSALSERPVVKRDEDTTYGPVDHVSEGGRHPWLVGQARKMAGWGWSEDRIADALRELNETICVPPLSERAMEPGRMARWAKQEIAPDVPSRVTWGRTR